MPRSYKVKNINLAKQGDLRINWATKEMPVVAGLSREFKKTKPLKGLTVAACLHITKETGVLLLALRAAGAKVVAAGSNPLSTQDPVAASLAKQGVHVFAWKGQNNKDYYECLNKALDYRPHITIDDGADLISLIHAKRRELLKTVRAGQEETTTGVIRLRAMAKDGALEYPVIAINDTPTKHLFDNYYGTGQSTIDAILRATNILLAGKKVVVAGYGNCGSGIALRAKGMGAHVLITEVDAVKALKATMDGFKVLPMATAAKVGEVFITATGDKNVIRGEHVKTMKDGAILCNAGHFNVEINLNEVNKLTKKSFAVNEHLEQHTLKNSKTIFVLSEGRLVNLAAAEGHPSSVMDMSFAGQLLTTAWLAKHAKTLAPGVHEVPDEIDVKVATLKLKSLGIAIDQLTPEQQAYLSSWQEGT